MVETISHYVLSDSWTDIPEQTLQTKIKIFLKVKDKADQALHCLPFHQHFLEMSVANETSWLTGVESQQN